MIHFAQLSDIHIGLVGNHHEVLAGQATNFLANVVADLSHLTDLDFVLISGDISDSAHPDELAQFEKIIQTLPCPCYIVPGNHDRHPNGLTRYQFAQRFNPQIDQRPIDGQAQASYWSIAVHPDVQLIGLDSMRDENWGGIIDLTQMAWLKDELATHADKLIMLMVHHPFHSLAPVDYYTPYQFFVCDNSSEVLALLDQHPQVKVVLTGHHHQVKADWFGSRLHLACPGLSIYPCAYRSIRLQQVDGAWQFEWHTYFATDEATVATARQISVNAWQAAGFNHDFVEDNTRLALGNNLDWHGQAIFS